MDPDNKQILMMLIWMFMQHGRADKAIVLAQAVHEADPKDALCGAVYARLLLDDVRAEEALAVIRSLEFPEDLRRMQALMEARALVALGRREEGVQVWNRYLTTRKRHARKQI